jgi:hypothetical protein
MRPHAASELHESMAWHLARALRDAWSAETSADERWSPEQRSLGQCAVTALIVQDHLGGKLIRAEVEGVSHYWNRLPDGTEIDLTRDQFAQFSPGRVETRSREYVLSFPETARRYHMLEERLAESDAASRSIPG